MTRQSRRRVIDWAVIACLSAAIAISAPSARAADAFPTKPIRFVVGFSPGNSIDTVARILAEYLRATRNWTVVVDNRTGANGILAAAELQSARHDGYTVLISNASSITVNPLIYKNLSYDPSRFAPVTAAVAMPFVLAVNPANSRLAGVNTLADLLALARRKPGELLYGSAGNGNLIHLASALLGSLANVQMTHVPYRGAAPMEVAILDKSIDFGFDTTFVVPLVKAGELSALAVSTAERWPDLPDVPTVAEQGFPGYDVSFWVGVFLPPYTPDDIVQTLYQAIKAATEDPATRQLLAVQGRVVNFTPAQFAEAIKAETARNAAIVREARIEIE